MHILYFCYPLTDDSAPHQAMAAFYLARNKGTSLTFMAWGNQIKPEWLSDYSSINYRLFPKNGWGSALRFLFASFRAMRRLNPDYVYVQGAQQTPFLLWLPFLKGKSRLIFHTQDYFGPGYHWFYETCERFFARQANWVISNEPNRARFMASFYQLKRMPEVVRTALPRWWPVPNRDERYRQELIERAYLRRVNKPRLIVAGGGYSKIRMSSEVIEAISQLPENYALIFTGMEPGIANTSICEQCLEIHGVKNRVVCLETLSYEQLLRLYAACDLGILLYPNNFIGNFYQAPGRLTEYLRCGLPIVTSNFPGLELLFLKYDLGAVANPYKPIDIAKAIQKIGDVDDFDLMATKARLIHIAKTELCYEEQADQVFRRILANDLYE